MAIRHQRSVGLSLASAVCALMLGGCSAPLEPVRVGALELHIESEASYALVGRFHVNAVEPWSPSRDVDFDAATSRARIELPPGTFALALAAGARLECTGDEPEPFAAPSSVPRLVSAAPQIISITAGELTTARIRFAAPPGYGEPAEEGATGAAQPADPCSSPLALSELAARH